MKAPNDTLNIALEINGVLSFKGISEHSGPFFLRNDLIITAGKTCYLVPGIFAFIRFLFSIENARISFFNSCEEECCKEFVKILLTKSLGKEQYLEVKDTIKVLSKDHLKHYESEDLHKQCDIYQDIFHCSSNLKKISLKDVIEDGDTLENCMLVAPTFQHSAPGEENNLLFVPRISGANYSIDLKPKYKNGYKFIKCKSFTEEVLPEFIRRRILKGKEITIIRSDETFKILFKHLETQEVNCLKLDPETDNELIKALNQANVEDPRFLSERNRYSEAIQEIVHNKVLSLGGKIKKILRGPNRICYVAGMIFHAIQTARKEQTNVSDILFRIQFQQLTEDPPTFEFLRERAWNEKIYHLGLAKLQEFEPILTFTTTQTLQQFSIESLTPEERRTLEQYKANEVQCTIL